MELIYYSYYPYNDPEFRTIEDEDGMELCVKPFRLYRAATCKALTEFDSEKSFVEACFEAMDRPDASNGDVTVDPTTSFYGATTIKDGVYVIKSCGSPKYYVISREGVIEFPNWYEAVLDIWRFNSDQYSTKLVDFTKSTI